MVDTMDLGWVCLTCSHKTTFGKLLAHDVLRCPSCRSSDLYPLDHPEFYGNEDLMKETHDDGK